MTALGSRGQSHEMGTAYRLVYRLFLAHNHTSTAMYRLILTEPQPFCRRTCRRWTMPFGITLARAAIWLVSGIILLQPHELQALILWNEPGTRLVRDNGSGADLLGGAVKRDDTSNDTLYFKFHVRPISDKDTEDYYAGFELYDGDVERLGVGNSLSAWAYSAFTRADDRVQSSAPTTLVDLHSSRPESLGNNSYQYPRRSVEATIVFKVQFIPGEDDLVTVWLNPDLGPGANEAAQPDSLTTRFNADASFDEIRLRHGGKGGGWIFSDLSIATAFSDFVDASSPRSGDAGYGMMDGLRSMSIQAWNHDTGLPVNPVSVLARDANGFIWVGGNQGLARFDGLNFLPVDSGIANGGLHVTALWSQPDGTMWIGDRRAGLLMWQGGHLAKASEPGLPETLSVTALVGDHMRRLWVGATNGLFMAWIHQTDAQSHQIQPFFSGKKVTALATGTHGSICVAIQGEGLYFWETNKFIQMDNQETRNELAHATSILVDSFHRVWVGTESASVLCLDSGHWQTFHLSSGRMPGSVTSLAMSANGVLWAATEGPGLWQIKGRKVFPLPLVGELAPTQPTCLLADPDGRLWAGTESNLFCLRSKVVLALGQNDGLGYGPVHGMAEVTPGVIWVGKPRDGLYRWNGRTFGRLPVAGLSPQDSQVSSILVTHEGFCWVSTTHALLVYKDSLAAADEVWTLPHAPPGISALAEGPDDSLWMGTRSGGIYCLKKNQWTSPVNLQVTNAIQALISQRDGTWWIGTAGAGLYEIQSGVKRRWDLSSGLPDETIETLFLDLKDRLWIGTSSRGLVCLAGSHMNVFGPQEGIPPGPIYQIMEDADGRLWLGTGHGIYCVGIKDLDALKLGEKKQVSANHFGIAAGMTSESCVGGGFPSGLKDKTGALWFPTQQGVVVVNPSALPNGLSAPKPILDEVLVDGISAWPGPGDSPSQIPGRAGSSDSLRVPAGPHRVDFHFTAVNFEASELMHFQYRLDPLDRDWVDAGNHRTAVYNYLPPGQYVFKLEVCNPEGSWTQAVVVMKLEQLRHYWQTWWFLAGAGLGVLVVVGAAVRLVVKGKMQRRLRMMEQERVLDLERTRIARDLHDEMGAKLCRISYLSEHARRIEMPNPDLGDQIASISEVSREVLHSLDEIVWAVNPQNDTLDHLASYIGQYAQEYFSMTGMECELDIPPVLDSHPLSSQARHHLFMATHEALTNILKHSKASRASIRIALESQTLRIQIHDNGCGFDLAKARAMLESSMLPNGDGITNMSRRLKDIGGEAHIESKHGMGTMILFVLPLKTKAGNKTS